MSKKNKLLSIVFAVVPFLFTSCSSSSPFHGHNFGWWLGFIGICLCLPFVFGLYGWYQYSDNDSVVGVIVTSAIIGGLAWYFGHYFGMVPLIVLGALCAVDIIILIVMFDDMLTPVVALLMPSLILAGILIYFATVYEWWMGILIGFIFILCAALLVAIFIPLAVFDKDEMIWLSVVFCVMGLGASIYVGINFYYQFWFWGILFGPICMNVVSWIVCSIVNNVMEYATVRSEQKSARKLEKQKMDAVLRIKKETEKNNEKNRIQSNIDDLNGKIEEIGNCMTQLESAIQRQEIDIRSLENLEKNIRDVASVDKRSIPEDYIKKAKEMLSVKKKILMAISTDAKKLPSFTSSVKVRFNEMVALFDKIF